MAVLDHVAVAVHCVDVSDTRRDLHTDHGRFYTPRAFSASRR